jgi:hypothetical protein
VKLSKTASLALVCVALPLAAGCSPEPRAFQQFANLDQSKNARVAYLATNSDKEQPTFGNTETSVVGRVAADITADGKTASYTSDPQGVSQSQKDLAYAPSTGEFYGDQNSNIVVVREHGLNEADDTFLTFHENRFKSNNTNFRTEFDRGYVGTRSDASVIADLRGQADHSAIYSGTGSAKVAQGDYVYDVDGSMKMKVNFAGANTGLTGLIMQGTPIDPVTNPSGVNQVKFEGKFVDGTPDYDVSNIRLRNADGEVAAISNGGGMGSVFGAHAQGTMGAFSGTGQTTNDPGSDHSPVNIIGSFQGKTSDNN